jgi:DMSO/TMAO reductase YedYZ molybdopterin-dependent catalytic subunit
LCAIVLAIALSAGIVSAESAKPALAVNGSPSLVVNGEVEHPLTLTQSALAAMPRQAITVTDEKGTPATYEGVAVGEILRRAGAPLGKMRGKLMTRYVLAGAADGYHVLFALAEFDPDFTDTVVLLCDRRDGHALDVKEGLLRIVVPGEKRHARWIRGVVSLEVRSAGIH